MLQNKQTTLEDISHDNLFMLHENILKGWKYGTGLSGVICMKTVL